jgi:hypothetical protein
MRSINLFYLVMGICLLTLLPAFADEKTIIMQPGDKKEVIFNTHEKVTFEFQLSKIGSYKMTFRSKSSDQDTISMANINIHIKKDTPFVMLVKKSAKDVKPILSFSNLANKKTNPITVELSEVLLDQGK